MFKTLFTWLGNLLYRCFQSLISLFEAIFQRIIDLYNQVQEWASGLLRQSVGNFLEWVLEHLPGNEFDYISGLSSIRRAFAYMDDFLPLHECLALAGIVFAYYLVVKRFNIVFKVVRFLWGK